MEDSHIPRRLALKASVSYLIKKIRTYFIKRKLSTKDIQILLLNPFIKVNIMKDKSAKIYIKGKLKLGSSTDNSPISICLFENSTLSIEGDVTIGGGTEIILGKNGSLKIGGRQAEKESMIGNGSKIYVSKNVEIGTDFLSAYNVFITDCDWHYIEYSNVPNRYQSDTVIGNHVWVGHETSILKGTIIRQGSIVGCRSVLTQQDYPENSLIIGTPAKVVKSNCKWKYDQPAPV